MTKTAPQQLSLSIQLLDDATFANYWVAPSNRIVLKALEYFCCGQGDLSLFVWGVSGCGLTHLLQACSHQSQLPIAYLPLKDALDLNPAEVCANLENIPLVCVDDVEYLATNPEWEQAFFHLFNRLRDNGHRLLMAAHEHPSVINLPLPDLRSRLLGSVIYRVDILDAEHKALALQMRAQSLGMKMSLDIAHYVIKHTPNRMKDLFDVLNELDAVSLQQKKKLSLRFVKALLDTKK